ncbi:ABC transporter, ATP-binding protein [Bacillus sp. JCM 19045]|nr:ABC transporter, ATP-binding protein [Bacillus sp. JCM 19045]
MTAILELQNVCKQYEGSAFKLNEVSFTIPNGSIVGFIGSNGAGKTTTMGTIIGTLKKDSGTIHVFGEEFLQQPALKEEIGVVFDNMTFSNNLNTSQLGKVMRLLYKSWDQEMYRHYLKLFSLPAKEKIKGFSRGMSMKLSLAVALSHDAKLFILDEATAGLDPAGRAEILEVCVAIVKEKKRGILMSSHITSDIEKIADKLIFIKDGEIVLNVMKETLLQKHGIFSCTRNDFEQLNKANIVAYFERDDLIDVLLSTTDGLPAPFTKQPFSIDDVSLILMRGVVV